MTAENTTMPQNPSSKKKKIRPSSAAANLQSHPSFTSGLYGSSARPSTALGHDRGLFGQRPATQAGGPRRPWQFKGQTEAQPEKEVVKHGRRLTLGAVDGIAESDNFTRPGQIHGSIAQQLKNKVRNGVKWIFYIQYVFRWVVFNSTAMLKGMLLLLTWCYGVSMRACCYQLVSSASCALVVLCSLNYTVVVFSFDSLFGWVVHIPLSVFLPRSLFINQAACFLYVACTAETRPSFPIQYGVCCSNSASCPLPYFAGLCSQSLSRPLRMIRRLTLYGSGVKKLICLET